jgi:hypothetical protein
MQTPVWSSQPVAAAPLRTVDLFLAMLAWLGVPFPENLDGEAVWLPGKPAAVSAGSERVLQNS